MRFGTVGSRFDSGCPDGINYYIIEMFGIEQEGGRGDICSPVEEDMGKPWVSQG